MDNPLRDLTGLTLVAWRLCQTGATCFLVPLNLQMTELPALAPDFVLLNYLRIANEESVRRLMHAGIRVGVMDTEGSIFAALAPDLLDDELRKNGLGNSSSEDAFENYVAAMARDQAVRYEVACCCAWSEPFARYAVRAGWYREDQMVTTGTPRTDLYVESWHRSGLQMSAFADEFPGPMILLNSSFGLANPRFQTPEAELASSARSRGFTLAYLEKRQSLGFQAARLFTAMANDLARTFPNASVVYRPHPFEGDTIYRFLLESLPNLHLSRQGTIEGWMLRAKVLIHWESSTAMDAGLMGVPCLRASWIPNDVPIPIIDAITRNVQTRDELMQAVDQAINNKFHIPESVQEAVSSAVDLAYHKIDGHSHERVATAILRSLERRPAAVSMSACANMAYGLDQFWRRRFWLAKARLRRSLGLSVHWSFRHFREWYETDVPWYPGKRFDAEQVTVIVKAIEEKGPVQGRPVRVCAASETDSYHFGFKQGRSVMLAAT